MQKYVREKPRAVTNKERRVSVVKEMKKVRKEMRYKTLNEKKERMRLEKEEAQKKRGR